MLEVFVFKSMLELAVYLYVYVPAIRMPEGAPQAFSTVLLDARF